MATITASLKIMGKTYEAKGKTVEEVIGKLNPPVAKTMGILVLEKGKLKRVRILNSLTVTSVFGKRSPTTVAIATRNLVLLFSDFDT